jgi:hypothetical protein
MLKGKIYFILLYSVDINVELAMRLIYAHNAMSHGTD